MADAREASTVRRVLRVLTRSNLGGPSRQMIALWHAHRAAGVETLLVVGRTGADEVELVPEQHGVPAAAPEHGRGGVVRLASLRRGLDPLADRRALRALRALARAFRPDVVHTHTSKAGWLGRRAAWAEHVPVVAHTFHGHVLRDYFGPLRSWAIARLERRLARRTDLLFAVSDSCADELAALGVAARDRLRVLPPAVDVPPALPRAAAREALGIPADAWRVCAVGRLVPIKRMGDFVAAIAAEPTLGGDLFGDGPERAALADRAARTAGGRALLRGARADVQRLLTAYDAVVLPSVREGCPLVAIEAFAAGVPVVGYDVPGVRDALQQFGRGALVPEADGPLGLVAALRALRADPDGGRAGAEAAAAAARACRPEAVANELLAAYAAVRAGRAAPRYHGAAQG